MGSYVRMPKLGMGIEKARLVEWKAKEGDWVERGSVVLVIETEKIEWEIEAEASGFLHILVKEGEEAAMDAVVGLIAETKEELASLQKETPEAMPAAAGAQDTSPPGITRVETAAPPVSRAEEGERIRISPLARKLAEEHMIDITKVKGTGPGGRIVREDIEREIEAKKKVEAAPATYQGRRVKFTIPLKGMRRTIAERMQQSLSISAQLTEFGEIDMTEVVKLRESLLSQAETIGAKITYTDILVFVLAKALKENPLINSSLIENEIKVWEDINIGVAVALEEGLIVPVVKNADKKTLVEISQSVKALVDKAREKKLMPEEVTGGTFTLTNLGALSGRWSFWTPIINQPESAILGTGTITDRAVVREGQIVIRPIMTYSLTYDHRVIDGAVAAKFMSSVIRLLENPSLLLL